MTFMGKWAKKGAITLWSLLKNRAADRRQLRIFILGDPAGIADFKLVMQDVLLSETEAETEAVAEAQKRLLEAQIEFLDFTSSRFLRRYRRQLPQQCTSGC